MVSIDIPQIINTILVLFGIVGGSSLVWVTRIKKDLHSVRDIFDKLDDAATNNAITEDQFQAILTDARNIVHGPTISQNKPAAQNIQVNATDNTNTKDK